MFDEEGWIADNRVTRHAASLYSYFGGVQAILFGADVRNRNQKFSYDYLYRIYDIDNAPVPDETRSLDRQGNVTVWNGMTYEYSGGLRYLVSKKQGTTTLESYSYGLFGNRAGKTVGGVSTSYAYSGGAGESQLLLTGAGSDTAGYDYRYRQSGYTPSGQPARVFSYYVGGPMKKMSVDGVDRVEYGYDADGMRNIRVDFENGKTLLRVYSGAALVYEEEYTGTGETLSDGDMIKSRLFLILDGKDVGRYEWDGVPGGSEPVLKYHYMDSLGSRRFTVDGEDIGEIEEIRYGTWGEPAAGATEEELSDYRYTGKPYDVVTGLVYFPARDYDPKLGRFIEVDPVLAGMNWFGYCGNNPVKNVDTNGCIYVEGTDLQDNTSISDIIQGEYERNYYDSETKTMRTETINSGVGPDAVEAYNKFMSEHGSITLRGGAGAMGTLSVSNDGTTGGIGSFVGAGISLTLDISFDIPNFLVMDVPDFSYGGSGTVWGLMVAGGDITHTKEGSTITLSIGIGYGYQYEGHSFMSGSLINE